MKRSQRKRNKEEGKAKKEGNKKTKSLKKK